MKLTDKERTAYQDCKNRETEASLGDFEVKKNLFREYPKAARHFEQLFPNHYLDIEDLKNEKFLNKKIENLEKILNDHKCQERDIMRHIKETNSYFAIASVLHRYYTFGHHATHIFPEFSLGTSFRADYLLLGQNSSGWHLVFVELESVFGQITKANGSFGISIRKGIEQVEEWSSWLDKNYAYLRNEFTKHLPDKKQLPDELTQYDSTRIHFLVIAGRREDFSDTTYKKGRIIIRGQKIGVVHYDNILDTARSVVGRHTY